MVSRWFFLWALAITFVYAEESSTTPTPSACVSQANNATPPEKPVFPRLIPRPLPSKKELETVFISAEDAKIALESSQLVDVRSDKETQAVWIPQARRAPLEFLSKISFLEKEKTLFLVGNGKNDIALFQAAKTLIASSQSHVHVIQGGLSAWHQAGGAIQGNTAALAQPLLLNVAEFHVMLMQGAYVLSFDTTPSRQIQLPARLWISLSQKKSPVSQLKRLAKRFPSRLTPKILLLPDTAQLMPWRMAWNDVFHQEPLIFVGEKQQYQAYLDQQNRIATHANKPLLHRCDGQSQYFH